MSDKHFYLRVNGKLIEVSEEVYHTHYRAENKEKYFMEKLKKGHLEVDPDTKEAHFIPSREKSLEQLFEQNGEFPASSFSVEDTILKSILLQKLQAALHCLSAEERALIKVLFYSGKTEREAAEIFQVSQNTIHYRKNKILKKLREQIEK